MFDRALSLLPKTVKGTVYLRAFGLFKVPLLFYVRPSVIEVTDQECVVCIPLSRRTKNHLNSMYFGALTIGADCAGGLMAMKWIEEEGGSKGGQNGGKLSLVFKDLQAQFLKRAEGDVHFRCKDGISVRDMVRRALETGERQNMPVHITATVPSIAANEPVAEFVLTLSLKKKEKTK